MSIHYTNIDSALSKIIKPDTTNTPQLSSNKNASYDIRGDIKPPTDMNVGPFNISSNIPENEPIQLRGEVLNQYIDDEDTESEASVEIIDQPLTIRSKPPNANFVVGPWIGSSIMPDSTIMSNSKSDSKSEASIDITDQPLTIRSKPPNSQFVVGPWNGSSIMPDSTIMSDSKSDSKPEYSVDLKFSSRSMPIDKDTANIYFKSEPHVFNSILNSDGGTYVNSLPFKNEYDDIIIATQLFFDGLCKRTLDQDKFSKIILINQEDDTVIPVIKIEDECMAIIKEWYELSELILDIEETDIKIPNIINKSELDTILFKPFPLTKKDKFVNDYLPKYIMKLILDKNLKQNINFGTPSSDNYFMPIKTPKISLSSLGINYVSFNTKKLHHTTTGLLGGEAQIEAEYYSRTGNGISSNDVVAYNYFDNNNYYNVTLDVDAQHKNELPHKNYTVILNYNNLNTIVVEEISEIQNKIINEYTEYGFIKLFEISTNNELVKGFIHNTYSNNKFNDKDEINKLLAVTSDFIGVYNKLDKQNSKVLDEQTQIKNFLENNFIIDDDINNRVKFTDLCSLIENSPLINIDKVKLKGLRNRLSGYLKNLGLQKKRYNDGYYYYGIKSKYLQEKTTDTMYENCKTERLHLEKQLDMEKLNPELLQKFNDLINIRSNEVKIVKPTILT